MNLTIISVDIFHDDTALEKLSMLDLDVWKYIIHFLACKISLSIELNL